MCCRVSLTRIVDELKAIFPGTPLNDYPPRWNIAPGQPLLCACQVDDKPVFRPIRWGLIPAWSRQEPASRPLLNARAETVAEKPSFRNAFRDRRCLVVVDGFYEWSKAGTQKQPYLFRRRDRSLFFLAGVWETYVEQATRREVEGCAILTSCANDLMQPIHHRMPVKVPAVCADRWLSAAPGDVADLLQVTEWPDCEVVPVSPYVNNPRHEGPECHQRRDDGLIE